MRCQSLLKQVRHQPVADKLLGQLADACDSWPGYGLEWAPSTIASELRCADGRLLRIAFTTVFDYILLLRVVAQELQACCRPAGHASCRAMLQSLIVSSAVQSCGRDAMFYLAAAVSDFYVPW